MRSAGHIKKLELDLVSFYVGYLGLPPRSFFVLAHVPNLKGLHVEHSKFLPGESSVELTEKVPQMAGL
jgi:hypothetical protein